MLTAATPSRTSCMRSWYCRRKAFQVGSGGTSSSLFAPYCATRLETSSEERPVSRVTLSCAKASSPDNRNHDVSTAVDLLLIRPLQLLVLRRPNVLHCCQTSP